MIYDCRLLIGEVPFIWRVSQVLFQCLPPLEMLNMKIDPDMCMKTKEAMTKYPANYMPFTKKMHELRPV